MPRSSSSSPRGSVPALAIFTIFVILGVFAAMYTFQAGYQRQASALQQRMAGDKTRATLAAIESELNNALYDAISAAMYEAGLRAENKENVELRIRQYKNQRIGAGWDYFNFRLIHVPYVDENNLRFEWLPDGSIAARGWLEVELEHVLGARGYGVQLNVLTSPRFQRLWKIARVVSDKVGGVGDLSALERKLNENYASEGIGIILENTELGVIIMVRDEYFGRRVIVGGLSRGCIQNARKRDFCIDFSSRGWWTLPKLQVRH